MLPMLPLSEALRHANHPVPQPLLNAWLPLPLPRQTEAVKEIMAQVISKRSAEKYAGQNAIFAMFCFNSAGLRVSLLEEWFVEKVTTSRTMHKKRKYVKDCLINMSPDDDNCPFKLSNLTFVRYSDFITQRKAHKGKHRGKMMPLGNVSYEQSQSALKHLFRMIKYAMSADFLTASSNSRRASGNTLLIRKYPKVMLPLLERRRWDLTCTKQFAS